MEGLTPKQALFVQEYLVDLNATQAAIRAGYSEKTAAEMGYENLRKPQIQAAVTEAMQKRVSRVELSQDYVIRSVIDTMERCKQAVPVLDRKGEPVFVGTPDGELAPAYMFQPAHILKGSEILGKHLGMFDGKKGVDDPEETEEEKSLRSIGRKLAFVLQGAVSGGT
jgi:phage terminase small subunit